MEEDEDVTPTSEDHGDTDFGSDEDAVAARLAKRWEGQVAEGDKPAKPAKAAKPAKPAKPAKHGDEVLAGPDAPEQEETPESDDEGDEPEAEAEGDEPLTLDSLEKIAEAAGLELDSLLGQVVVQAPHGAVPLGEALKGYYANPTAEHSAAYHQQARERYDAALSEHNRVKDAELAKLQETAVVLQRAVFGDEQMIAQLRADAAKGDAEASSRYFAIVGDVEARRNALHQARQLLRDEQTKRAEEARRLDIEYRAGEVRKLTEKLPMLQNREKAAEFVKDVQGLLTTFGFGQEEIDNLADHRMILVVNLALKEFRRETAAAAARSKVTKRAPRLQLGARAVQERRAAAQAAGGGDVDALTARARETGRDEDVANLIANKLQRLERRA